MANETKRRKIKMTKIFDEICVSKKRMKDSEELNKDIITLKDEFEKEKE